MDDNLRMCINLLKDNNFRVRTDALLALLSLCEKIISQPNDIRYRRVRVNHPTLIGKLLPASGAMQCIFEMGFVEDGEFFTLPQDAPLSRFRQVQKVLRELLIEDIIAVRPDARQLLVGMGEPPRLEQSAPVPKIHQNKNFLERLEDEFRHVLKYEKPLLQNKARQLIPLKKLQKRAVKRLRSFQLEIKRNDMSKAHGKRIYSEAEQQFTVEDFLLAELLNWFKKDFFTWVDSPKCGNCRKMCKYERIEPSLDPRISRIEIHRCHDCHLEVKFARYTSPGILLRTRRGRCGEWANVFTLLCRSLGFDARLVHDETDHVWTEVWSIASNKWIHADPCENSMDRPLMYERGWNKKLTYVIACSKDEIQDVTWRYTRKQEEVMQRRILCTEEDLVALIMRLNEKRQNSPGYSAARKQFVTKRRALELVDFMPAPPGTKKPGDDEGNEYGGRTSGSLAWRTSRGEIEKNIEAFVWKIPEEATQFELRYFAAKDEYEKIINNDPKTEKKIGWLNGVNATEGGIFRKVETDWKMVYLARSAGQTIGKITWTLETADPRTVITDIKFKALCETFHSGKIEWKIIGRHTDSKINDIVISVENSKEFERKPPSEIWKISITAEMSGGLNDEAWQHAQIFRQKLDDTENLTMSIIVRTKKI